MTTYQVRDPAVDNAEDGWTEVAEAGIHRAASRFRELRGLGRDHPVEVMNGSGLAVSVAKVMKPLAPPQTPPEPPKPPAPAASLPPKEFRPTPGSGQKGKDVATILKEVAQRPGMTGEELMAEVFGPEAMPLFKEMLAFRGTLFGMKREGQLKNQNGRYFPAERRSA